MMGIRLASDPETSWRRSVVPRRDLIENDSRSRRELPNATNLSSKLQKDAAMPWEPPQKKKAKESNPLAEEDLSA